MDDELEMLVADFLRARESDPALSASGFVTAHGARADELRDAIAAALEAEALLPDAPSRPATIGPYHVVRELGRGAMAVVYQVERGDERYALKWLGGSVLLGANGHARFLRECAILERLAHPGIVRIVDHGEHGGLHYLVMELIEGSTLADSRFDVATAVRVVRELAQAVGAAHAAGVVHRDLKPSNVMLRADGSPVLLDFGLGGVDEDGTLTGSGAVIGTPRYMAPEQARGEVADARSDVFALGVMLFEWLAGVPARSTASRERMLIEAAQGRIGRLPRGLDLPPALVDIVSRATARRPSWRYPDADRLVEDLARFERGEKVLASPPGPVVRALDRLVGHTRSVVAAGFLVAVAAVALVWGGDRPSTGEESAAARAARLVRERRLPEAVEAYHDAIRDGSESVSLWAGLARTHYQLAQYKRGLEAVDRALALGDAKDPSLRNLRAAMLDALGRGDEAQAILTDLCAEFPDDRRYLFNLAHSFDASGRVREARTRYEQLLEREPGHRQAKASLAWLCATASGDFADLRDHDRATALCMQLLEEGAGGDTSVLSTIIDIARITARNAEFADALQRAATNPSLSELQRRHLTDQARAVRSR